MAILKKRRGKLRKTKFLNMRVDEKFDFGVWFVAELKGWTKDALVTRTMLDYLDAQKLPDGRTWEDFWDSSEAVRTLRMLNARVFKLDADDEETLAFTRACWPFFYRTVRGDVQPEYVELLWPKIHDYVDGWREANTKKRAAVVHLMEKALQAAGYAPPEMPDAAY